MGAEVEEQSRDQPKNIKYKTHRLSATCVCIDSNDRYAYSGSKDGSLIKWCLKTQKILAKVTGLGKANSLINPELKKSHHLRHINCIAISSNNKYLVSGGWDRSIRVWNPKDLSLIQTLEGHRGEVTDLVFRMNTLQLYSSSADKSIKLWTLDEEDSIGYIESLFGHESPITSIDALKKERILSAGGRDQSIRIWKIVEQSQSVYTSSHESVDIVKYIDDKTFISGGEDGSLALWSTQKRNPEFVISNAHSAGNNQELESLKTTIEGFHCDKLSTNFWISALATYVKPQAGLIESDTKRQKLDTELEQNSDGSDKDSGASDNEEDEKQHVDAKKSEAIYVASGSCNNSIQVWQVKITGTKYTMKLHKSISCPGYINSLKFTKTGDKIVAAVGQEHKSGRWFKVKNAVNKIFIFDVPN